MRDSDTIMSLNKNVLIIFLLLSVFTVGTLTFTDTVEAASSKKTNITEKELTTSFDKLEKQRKQMENEVKIEFTPSKKEIIKTEKKFKEAVPTKEELDALFEQLNDQRNSFNKKLKECESNPNPTHKETEIIMKEFGEFMLLSMYVFDKVQKYEKAPKKTDEDKIKEKIVGTWRKTDKHHDPKCELGCEFEDYIEYTFTANGKYTYKHYYKHISNVKNDVYEGNWITGGIAGPGDTKIREDVPGKGGFIDEINEKGTYEVDKKDPYYVSARATSSNWKSTDYLPPSGFHTKQTVETTDRGPKWMSDGSIDLKNFKRR